jgi:hypothetical protein
MRVAFRNKIAGGENVRQLTIFDFLEEVVENESRYTFDNEKGSSMQMRGNFDSPVGTKNKVIMILFVRIAFQLKNVFIQRTCVKDAAAQRTSIKYGCTTITRKMYANIA